MVVFFFVFIIVMVFYYICSFPTDSGGVIGSRCRHAIYIIEVKMLYRFEVFHGVIGVAVKIAVRMPFGEAHFELAPSCYKLFG